MSSEHEKDAAPGPAWHPKQPLRAKDLLSLESYLLSSARCIDPREHGVDSIDPDSITLQDGEVVVRKVRGVCVSAEPTIVEGDYELRTKVPDADEPVDLWIRVNARGVSSKNPPKLMLEAEQGSTKLNPAEEHADHRLYLGRVKFGEEGASWVRMPFVRRLDATGRLPGWEGWVQPFTDKIDELLESEEGPTTDPNRRATYWAALFHLAFHWRILPLPSLVQHLAYLSWLGTAETSGRANGAVDRARNLAWKQWTGHDTPTRLAGQLGELKVSQEGMRLTAGASLDEHDVEEIHEEPAILLRFRKKHSGIEIRVPESAEGDVRTIVVESKRGMQHVPSSEPTPRGYRRVFRIGPAAPEIEYRSTGLWGVRQEIEYWT